MENVRLIDANALKEEINNLAIPIYEKMVLKAIDNAPTVKIDTNDIEYKAYCKGLEDGKKIARPQGEWRVYEGVITCEKCGEETEEMTPFCAWCGADMRGGKNEGAN